MDDLLGRCRALLDSGAPKLEDLVRAVSEGDGQSAVAMAQPDSRRPYGRKVLFAGEHVEGMVARWTPAYPCAPHDHGGSFGAVRVLSGRVKHRIWRVTDGAITLAREEERAAGDILICGPDMVHSMVDAGGDEPLVTLHLYTDPIGHMVVYDVATAQTVVVQGECGAWIPVDQPELIRSVHDGVLRFPEVTSPDEDHSWQDRPLTVRGGASASASLLQES